MPGSHLLQPYVITTQPIEGESLDSLACRLARWNSYPTTHWVYRDTFGPDRLGTFGGLSGLSDSAALQRLSDRSRLTPGQLQGLTASRWAPLLTPNNAAHVHANDVAHLAWIQKSYTKVCPDCLSVGTDELNERHRKRNDRTLRPRYHRAAWDLVVVTACLQHQTLLVDRCPHGKDVRIPIARLHPEMCGCGESVVGTHLARLDQPGFVMQQRVHAELGLLLDDPISNDGQHGRAFFEQLHVLALLVWMRDHAKPGRTGTRPKVGVNADQHAILTSAYGLMCADSGEIGRTISAFRGRGHGGGATGLQRDFGILVRFLRDHAACEALDPLREALDSHLRTEWDGGYVSMFRGFGRTRPIDERRFLSLSEAARELGCTTRVLASGIASGKLTAARVARRQGRSTLYLFDPEEITRFKEQVANALERDQVCQRLGLDRKQIGQLVTAKLIRKIGLAAPYRYAAEDVRQLESAVAALPLRDGHSHWLSADEAARLARVPLSTVLRGVLDGTVSAAREPTSVHLLGLSVRDSDAFRLRAKRNSEERGVIPEVLASQVGYGKRSLERWANEGLIACTRTTAGRPRMTVAAVEAFRQTYATSQEVELILGITRNHLYQLVAKGTIVPASQTGDSRSLVLFKRSEIEALANEEYVPLHEAARLIGRSSADILRHARQEGIHDRRMRGADGRIHYHLPSSYVMAQAASIPISTMA